MGRDFIFDVHATQTNNTWDQVFLPLFYLHCNVALIYNLCGKYHTEEKSYTKVADELMLQNTAVYAMFSPPYCGHLFQTIFE